MRDPDLGTFARELLDGKGANLSSAERLILLALARHADANGAAYPSVELLAKETGYDRRTVMRRLRSLEFDKRLITVRRSASPLSTNIYELRSSLLQPAVNHQSGSAMSKHAPGAKQQSSPPSPPVTPGQPMPQGKAPSEYKYKYLDKEELLRNREKSKDSEGTTPSPRSRIQVDSGVFQQELEDASLRLAYFIADALIDRGKKQDRFRQDASDAEWLAGAERILFETGVPHRASLQEVERGILLFIDSEDGEWVRRPTDLFSKDGIILFLAREAEKQRGLQVDRTETAESASRRGLDSSNCHES